MGHAKDYPYIRAWGRMMTSNRPYVQDQEALARVERAPANAIYKGDEGWKTYDDIVPGDVRHTIDRLVKEERDG